MSLACTLSNQDPAPVCPSTKEQRVEGPNEGELPWVCQAQEGAVPFHLPVATGLGEQALQLASSLGEHVASPLSYP